jgi:hypothetical protein
MYLVLKHFEWGGSSVDQFQIQIQEIRIKSACIFLCMGLVLFFPRIHLAQDSLDFLAQQLKANGQQGFSVLKIEHTYLRKGKGYDPQTLILTPLQTNQDLSNLMNRELTVYRYTKLGDHLDHGDSEEMRNHLRREIALNKRQEEKQLFLLKQKEQQQANHAKKAFTQKVVSEESEDDDESGQVVEDEFCGKQGRNCCEMNECEMGLLCQNQKCQSPPPPCGEFEEMCCADQNQSSPCAPDLLCQQDRCLLPPPQPKQLKKYIAKIKIVQVLAHMIKAVYIHQQTDDLAKEKKMAHQKQKKPSAPYEKIMLDDIAITEE